MKVRVAPIDKQRFIRRVDRITDLLLHHPPPVIIANEFQLALWAYYGNRRRACMAIISQFVWSWWNESLSHFRMSICDRMKWTIVYPETGERHGKKCSGSPNCANCNCIPDSVPRWFKVLTFWKPLL